MKRNPEFIALITITCVLLFFGLMMAYSASAPVAEEMMQDDYFYFKRMLAFGVLGVFCLALASVINYEVWTRHWKLFYAAAVVGLLLVFTPLGVSAGGARRSFTIGVATVQPSEFARLAVVFFLASFCSDSFEFFLSSSSSARSLSSSISSVVLAIDEVFTPKSLKM